MQGNGAVPADGRRRPSGGMFEAMTTRYHDATPATARIAVSVADMPRRLGSLSTSIHSSSEWARPPLPPEPILMAGIPSAIGMFASVDDATWDVLKPCASIAA